MRPDPHQIRRPGAMHNGSARPARRGRIAAWVLGLAIAPGVLPLAAAAQAVPPPTAADTAAVLLDAARAFEEEGREGAAEALYERLTERYPDTPAGAAARERLGRLAVAADREGRIELQVWGTLYGIWLGVAVPTAFGASGTEAYGAGLLLGAPSGLLAARALTRARPFGEGQARAVTWGGTWGTWQGFGWAEVLDLGDDQTCTEDGFCYPTDDDTEETFAAMIAGGLVGAGVGALLARGPVPPGLASGAHHGSLWGSWLGVATGILADQEDDRLLATTLLAGNVGLVGGALLADRYRLGSGRIRLLSVGGLVGGLAGAGLDLLLRPDSEDVAVAIPLVLSAGGLAVAAWLTRDLAPDAGGGGDPAGALLLRDGGRWSAGPPVPRPVLRQVRDRTGREHTAPGLGLTLLRARF